jgi:AraC-like DNA-binding protein
MDRRTLSATCEFDARLASANPAEVAAAVNLSMSRFSRLFSRDTGMTPHQYLRALRMERARLLLSRTFLTVKQAMAQVGISDASHFSRDFRAYHGMTPTAARHAQMPYAGSDFLSRHLERISRCAAEERRVAGSANG